MTLQLVGLAAAWLAALYRLWVSIRQPRKIWRTAFTIGILCAALGVTFQSFSPLIDSWTSPSVGSLLNHLIIVIGLASVQVYVSTLRRDTPPPRLLPRVACIAAVAELVTVVSWVLATPFHVGESEHFAVFATDVWVSLYFLSFWSLLGVTMLAVAKFCLLEQRGAPAEDRARVISMALIGLGALGGFLYALSAAAGVIYIAFTGVLDNAPLMASSRLIGPSVGLLGVGILALLVVPPFDATVRARRRLRVLRPLWFDLQHAVPGVQLGGPEAKTLSVASNAERAVIEIRDALDVLMIAPPTSNEPEAVAGRLLDELEIEGEIKGFKQRRGASSSHPNMPSRPAAAFLPASRTLQEDTEQVYVLAMAYRREREKEVTCIAVDSNPWPICMT